MFDSELFRAGFGLIGVGAGIALLRHGLRHGLDLLRRNSVVSLEIPSKDKSYAWFMEWMSTTGAPRGRHTSVETSFHQFENGEVATRVQFVPSPGVQYFRYGPHWIRCERQREKAAIDYTTGQLLETVTLTALGRSRNVFERLMSDARELALRKEQGSTVLYKVQGSTWQRFGFPRKRKPLESVILPPGQAHRIVGDVREFLGSGAWYTDKGIPYRRGYLLHGPPGCGKSSFIQALAGDLRLNVCILDLGSRNVTDDTLPHLLNTAPQRSIILLEDLDAAVQSAETAPGQAAHPHTALTFSGLSNALDGVAATEGGGRLVFMTTNRYDRLSPTLVRPGRVDRLEYVGAAVTEQVEQIFLKFFPGEHTLALQFAQRIPSGCYSMAQLQGYLLGYKFDSGLALERVDELLCKAPTVSADALKQATSAQSTHT